MADNQRTILIVAVVVLVVLCCCCAAIGVIGWFYGDQIVGPISRALPAALAM